MKQHKYASITISLLLIGVILMLFWSIATNSTGSTSNINKKPSFTHPLSKIKKNSDSNQTKQNFLIIHKDERENLEGVPNIVSHYEEILNPFEEEDIDLVAQSIKKIKGVEPIAAVRMHQGTIKNAKIGSKLLLPPIDGMSYEMKVETKQVSQNGTVSIEGNFNENGIVYSAILTEGKKATFISMYTPNGTYEVNIIHGIGYIYANADIEKAKIDYSKTDEIELPKNTPSEKKF